ncbi:MAG: hypothetical protein KGI41_00240, partial [Patescibacteria group bacterium]|nr:hypothetical protein [Patescibacteria group bacterium]
MAYRETGLDTYVHVCNRGTKKMPIYRNERDFERLRALLFYLNHDQPLPNHWTRDVEDMNALAWPSSWPERAPIVSVLAHTFMPNHIHLFLKETTE